MSYRRIAARTFVGVLLVPMLAFAQAPAPAAPDAAPGAPAESKWTPAALPQVPKTPNPKPQDVKRSIEYTGPTMEKLTCSKPGQPRTVILFIGDGMGLTHAYLGMIGGAGVRGTAHLELCDYVALASTHAANSPITDSAAGATAIATGEKTHMGAIAMSPDKRELKTLTDDAQSMGKWTGIVSNDSVTGATPACFYAHSGFRSREKDIAAQLPSSNVNVFIAGGAEFFTTPDQTGSTLQAEAEKAGYKFITTMADLRSAVVPDVKILALLDSGSRVHQTEEGPIGVSQMTQIAIEKLSKSPNGFFLMVEGSRIDSESHKNDGQKVIDESVDFDMAIGHGLSYAEKQGDVLVLVTADHETGGLTVPVVRERDQSAVVMFSTGQHTGVPVIVAAAGCGAPEFHGFIDNTDIAKTVRSIWK